MSARPGYKLLLRLLPAALLALGASRAARASDADPFADSPPSAGPPRSPTVPAAPASAPAESAASILPGAIEELPASAYPEPYTRGLYGGSLWLDMQGLQWPYTPRTGIGLSGYGWLDNDYELTRLGGPNTVPHTTQLIQQGRFLFRVTPTYTNGSWFVQGQAELVANKDQADTQANGVVDAEDVWVRTGVWQKWDLTVGRFQAFDVYPLGMGLDLNTQERLGAFDGTNTTATALYAASYLFYRPAGPGNIAFHLYPFPFLRVELLGQWGDSTGENSIGGRPAVIFDIGWLKLRGALEYQYQFAQSPDPMLKATVRNRGGAGSAQIVLAPYAEFGGNFGYAIYDEADAHANGGEDVTASGNIVSYGGFVNVSPVPAILPNLLIGAGGNYASQHDLSVSVTTGRNDRSTNLQTFVAVQYLFYRQLFVKLVGAYAKSHFDNTKSAEYDDDMYSVRLRVMYLF
jgi:hypothetical protein